MIKKKKEPRLKVKRNQIQFYNDKKRVGLLSDNDISQWVTNDN